MAKPATSKSSALMHSDFPASDQSETRSLADEAEAVIQQAIIEGSLRPASRLTLPSLELRFGIGATPLREGLSRLAARGLVTMIGNRGFRVSEITPEDLDDLIVTRSVVEAGALRLSMERRLPEWEDGIVASMFRLRRVIEAIGGPIKDGNQEYDRAHKSFHRALIAGCGAVRLRDLQELLYDQAYRYRRILGSGGLDPRRALDEHQRLADLALGPDVDAGCKAIAEHLLLTKQGIFSAHERTDKAE